ncbi:MAG: hypothetical protein JNM07_14545, partial [Phycisphaerae bacterium]|nr:hypothetical protein [Phycisphaerae bacterium]
FRTDDSAPRGRVIAIDIAKPERSNWKQIVPQQKDVVDTDDEINLLAVEAVSLLNNQIVVTYLKDARNAVRVFAKDGKPIREVKLPGLGTAKGFLGKPNDSETFFSFTGFTAPPRTIQRPALNQNFFSCFCTAAAPLTFATTTARNFATKMRIAM